MYSYQLFKIVERNALTVCLCCFAVFGYSQNLIFNPSFENHFNCPKILGNLEQDVAYWSAPTLGSTDYFNGCSKAMGTPKNFNGEQPANFGVGYVGLYFYAPEDYREYIQASLSHSLVKDEVYKVSFYVSLAERSDFAIKEFGIQFSEVPIKIETRKTLSKMHLSKVIGDVSNYVEISYDNFYSDKKDWVLVETEFMAKGTERYLIIGNFKDNKRTRKFKTKRQATHGSYYYLDMVSVEPKKQEVATRNTQETPKTYTEYKLNKAFTFNNVLFEFDTYQLVSKAKKELNQLASYLAENENLMVTINGHTDDVGLKNYNLRLSEQRAKAVADYLINKGIAKKRVLYYGYGSIKPKFDNKKAINRKKNRRVEFVFSSN
jgi:outer membrane protein OmpA-like peptidoglycan-associated protein